MEEKEENITIFVYVIATSPKTRVCRPIVKVINLFSSSVLHYQKNFPRQNKANVFRCFFFYIFMVKLLKAGNRLVNMNVLFICWFALCYTTLG